MTMIDASTVAELLSQYGLSEQAQGEPELLSGGVSCVVIAVGDVVVKQAREKFDVADDWFAPVERIADEADGLIVAGDAIPGRAPGVLHFDRERGVLVIARAPRDWEDMRTRLLRGEVDPAAGTQLGTTLALWHTNTATPENLERFADQDSFDAQRLDPFYRTAAGRSPRAADAIARLMAESEPIRVTLVHGDYSPKNVLAGAPGEQWIIDFEITHAGDPAFDAAFMLHHLLLKSVHLPAVRERLDEFARNFVAAYTEQVEPRLRPNPLLLYAHVAAQTLARAIGKSPAPYLDRDERELVRRLGEELLLAPPETLDQVFARRDELLD